MDKVIDLFAQSTIVQAIVTLLLVGGVVYQIITTNQANSTLVDFTALVLGFWFGNKSQQAIMTYSNRDKSNGK